jgi:hypothetical protein
MYTSIFVFTFKSEAKNYSEVTKVENVNKPSCSPLRLKTEEPETTKALPDKMYNRATTHQYGPNRENY